jgi:hypothetical protein
MSLIGQIRSHEDALKAAGSIESVPKFVTDVRMNCPHALERIKTGVAATVVVPSHDSRPSAAIVAETVSLVCLYVHDVLCGWLGAVLISMPAPTWVHPGVGAGMQLQLAECTAQRLPPCLAPSRRVLCLCDCVVTVCSCACSCVCECSVCVQCVCAVMSFVMSFSCV